MNDGNIIKQKITELETYLINCDCYDFKHIFERFEEFEALESFQSFQELETSKDAKYDNSCSNLETVKLLVASELMLKFGLVYQTNPTNLPTSNFKIELFNFDLNNIDKYLGTSFRTRLVKNFVRSIVKLEQKDGLFSTQLISHISFFFNLVKTIDISKFPDSWDVFYFFFLNFKEQLKICINNYLSNVTISSDQEITIHLNNITILFKFEENINNTLMETNSSYQLSIDDSLINLFENSLICFLNNIKKEIAILTTERINEISIKTYPIPDTKDVQIESFKLSEDLVTTNLILDYKKFLEKCNTYSTGKIYSALIKEILLQLTNYAGSLQNKYTLDRKKLHQNYRVGTEYLLFNIIFNINYCDQIVNQIRDNFTKKIQTKYVPNTEFVSTSNNITELVLSCIDTWVSESCTIFSEQFEKISNFKFDEKNLSVVDKQLNNYSTTVCIKYLSACKRAHKYLPEFCAQLMSEKLTYGVINLVICHILKLRGIHSMCCQYLDYIVVNLIQATNKAIDEKLIDEKKEILRTNVKSKFNVHEEPIKLKSYISEKITQIQTIINAIAVENNTYNETIHNTIFCHGFNVPYTTMISVKGCMNVQNFHRVTVSAVNEKVSTVVDATVGSANTVVDGSITIADKLTKFVTGKDDSSHGSPNNSSHGSSHGSSSGKQTDQPQSNSDDYVFGGIPTIPNMPTMPKMSEMVGGAKKMFEGMSLSSGSSKDMHKVQIKQK